MRGSWEIAVAKLLDEPGGARIAAPGARVLVWSLDGERLLWRSRGAKGLVDLWSDGASGEGPDARRLRVLGTGLAPRHGFRLERWRLGRRRLDPPVTVACRIIASGVEDGLLTAFLDAPSAKAPATSEPVVAEPSGAISESPPSPTIAAGLRRVGSRGRRFVWRMDAEGRVTEVSPGLQEGVGPEGSRIVGRPWHELAGWLVRDQGDAVARSLAAETGWSRIPVLWRSVERDRAVPADISGTPVLGADGRLVGYRGFGVTYPDDAVAVLEGMFSEAPTTSVADGTVAGAHATPALPVADELPGLDDAMDAAAKLTGSAGETVFGVLRALFGSQAAATASVAAARSGSGSSGDGWPAHAHLPGERSAKIVPAGSLSAAESGALDEIARALGSAAAQADAPALRTSAEIVPLPKPRPRPVDAARVLDRLPIPVMILRDDVPIFANPALLALAGHGDLPAWVASGGVAALFGQGLDALAEGGTPASLPLVTGAGIRETVEARRVEIGWGDAPATLVSLVRSPNPAREQERQALTLDLSASQSRIAELESSLDLAADGIVTLDPSGRILSVSRSAERLFGYAANEIVGEVVTILIAPADHRDALACLAEVGRTEPGTARECEARGRLRTGPARAFSIRAGMVRGDGGATYLLAFRDVSRFRALESELREARGVAERAGANRADFLARVSHEIRTPLTAITGFAELMLEQRFGPIGSERYRGYVRDIHASGEHVVSLVNDLLDLAKASSGQSDLEPASLDLNAIVEQCMALSAPLAGREKTILRTSYDRSIPRIRADERSVRQIVLNVLSNAIRFTGAGGQVIVSTASVGPGDVRLSVRDTGPGMSEDEIEAALTPFRQVPATRRGDGTGLGLPLSKALVEANGGIFSITSARDRGTLVAVHLPAAHPQSGAAAAE